MITTALIRDLAFRAEKDVFTALVLLGAGVCATFSHSTFADESKPANTTQMAEHLDEDPDDTSAMPSSLTDIHVTIAGTTFETQVMVGKSKVTTLFACTLGRPFLKTVKGVNVPLFQPDGSPSPQLLAGERIVIGVSVTDIMKDAGLAKAYVEALQNSPGLNSKTVGQARTKRDVHVELKYRRPLDGELVTIGRTKLTRVSGKSVHTLYLEVKGEALQELREVDSEQELEFSFSVPVFCRVSRQTLHAEATAFNRAFGAARSAFTSQSGDHCVWGVTTGGGDAESKTAFERLVKQMIEMNISIRTGEKVPVELINTLFDRVCQGIIEKSNEQHFDDQQFGTVLVGDRLLVTTMKGSISQTMAGLKNALQTMTASDLFSAQRHSLGGGASFMGVGANFSNASDEQKREMQQQMLSKLNDSLEQIQGNWTAFVDANAISITDLSKIDLRSIESDISKFSTRWEAVELGVSVSQNGTHAMRLANLFQKRDLLRSQLKAEMNGVEERAKEFRMTVEARKHLFDDLRSQFATSRNSQENIGLFDGFKRWCIHTHGNSGWYDKYMTDDQKPGQTRLQYLSDVVNTWNTANSNFATSVELMEGMRRAAAVDAAADAKATSRQLELTLELEAVQTEIEALLRLGSN